MTGNESSGKRQTGEIGERQAACPGRLFPKVTFGLSAAVLAGVVVVTVPAAPAAGAAGQRIMTTTGLSAAINTAAGGAVFETTCCGDE